MTPLLLNGAGVIHLRGSLATGEAPGGGRLSAAVAELADTGCAEIGVNLAHVTGIDARGLGALVLALRAARDRGARLVLVAPPPRVRRVLTITRLDTVFDVRESFGSYGARAGRLGHEGRGWKHPGLTAATEGAPAETV